MKRVDRKVFAIAAVVLLVFLSAFSCYAQTGTRGNWTTVEEAVAAIIAQMPEGSTYDKALWLHDWLTDNAYYAMGSDGYPSEEEVHHSAEGVLLQGTGVCESYAKAYQLLLNAAGIANEYVTGESINPNGVNEPHAWNLVQFDTDTWAYVDVTWDDPIDRNNPDTHAYSGGETHYYFGMSSELLSRDHTIDSTVTHSAMTSSMC